jgi:hypothetical protein
MVAAANVEGDPDQETVPVYPGPGTIPLTGVSPVTGLRNEMAFAEIFVGAAGNTAVITPEFAE